MNTEYVYHIAYAYETREGRSYLKDGILYSKDQANSIRWVQEAKDTLKRRHLDCVVIIIINWKRLGM